MTRYYINANVNVSLASGTIRGDARNFGQLLSKITLVAGDEIRIVVDLNKPALYVVDDTLSSTSNIPVGVRIAPWFVGATDRPYSPAWRRGVWFDDSTNFRCVVKVPESHELLVFGRRSSKTVISGVEFVRQKFTMSPTLRFDKSYAILIMNCKFSAVTGTVFSDSVGFKYPTFIKFDGVNKGNVIGSWFEIKSVDDIVKKIPYPIAGAITINKSDNITIANNYFDAGDAGGTTTPLSVNESGRVRVTENMFFTSNPKDYLPLRTKYFGAVMLTFCTTVVIDNNILHIDESYAGVLFLSEHTNYTNFVIRNNVFRYFGEISDGMVAVHVDCDDPGLGFVSILNNIISSVSGYGYAFDVFLDKSTSKVDYNMIDGISIDLTFVSRGSNPYTYADAPHNKYMNPKLLRDISSCDFSGKDVYFRNMVCVDPLEISPAIGTGSETTYIGIRYTYSSITNSDGEWSPWITRKDVSENNPYIVGGGTPTTANNLTDSVVVGMNLDSIPITFSNGNSAVVKNCTLGVASVPEAFTVPSSWKIFDSQLNWTCTYKTAVGAPSIPFAHYDDFYLKNSKYLLRYRKRLAPFDDITCPPNPGYGFPEYEYYPTGLFGYSRAKFENACGYCVIQDVVSNKVSWSKHTTGDLIRDKVKPPCDK